MADLSNRISGKDAQEDSAFAADTDALGMFQWDVTQDRLDWSPSDEVRLGLSEGAIKDLASWSTYVPPDDVRAIQALLADVTSQRRDRFTFRYRLLGGDGRTRAIEGAARCVYDEAGALVRTYGVNVDVTERIDREAALESLLATMPNAMVVVDARGRIHGFSTAAERLFGYEADALIGLDLAMLVPDSVRQQLAAHLDAYREARDREGPTTPLELAARRKGGAEIPVECCLGEMTIGGERRYTLFFRDLSDRADAEKSTTDLRNELAQVGRMAAMGELAASLAHELNQPLSATANFLAATVMLVERGGDQDKVAELVKLANDQILRAGAIIRRIREFIVKREVEVGIEPVEKTVRDAVSLVLVGAARMEVDVRYAFEHKGTFMLADRVQIQQVLVNLLRNATEALRDQPKHRRTILISARERPDEMIEISVSDTGPGIDARMLETIFTPLSSTKGSEGMGLGLSICRRIIEAHGGRLTAENRSAGGATFRFTLPAVSLEEAGLA